MRSKIEGKLVRDIIAEIITDDGGIPRTRTLSKEGYKHALLDKLVEEAIEAHDAHDRDQLMVELADVQEVLLAILTANGIDPEILEKLRKQRARVHGGFGEKTFLISVKKKK